MSESAVSGRLSNFADLTGRRAVVTGASSGIGQAIALELARAGCEILIHYAKSRQAADAAAANIRSLGARCELLAADLRDASHEDLVHAAWEQMGGVNIWINNAGVDLLTGDNRKLSYADKLQQLWEVDVRGTMLLCRAAGERMRSAGSGVILNIGWDQADRGMGGDSGELFSAAKNAIMGFTRSLAVSLAPAVRVNAIAPGWIKTAWGEQAGSEWQNRVLSETPLGRWGTPEDIARLARFLVSQEASYITGQVINANGGAVR